MFFISKILVLLTQPLAWVAMLLAAGVACNTPYPAAARRLQVVALAILLLVGWQPLPEAMLRHLEAQYPEVPESANLSGFAGLIVLGGATASGRVSQAHMHPQVGDSAERLSATVAVLQRYPHLRMVYTGGEGDLLGAGPSEADRARMFFEELGAKGPLMQYEAASRNTYENAVFTALVPGVDKTQRWLLVTSAWHMPRSMATFQKAGWNVLAYPVDYRTGDTTHWADYSMRSGADKWQLALNEMVGLVAYRITGRL
jgi:uncharacterized SAM-binding protein YcdF (DUF218 family)